MLDIKVIRQDPERVKAACKSRNKDMDAVVDEILKIDAESRTLRTEAEALKAEQNKASKQIPMIKKQGGDNACIILKGAYFYVSCVKKRRHHGRFRYFQDRLSWSVGRCHHA